MADGKGHIFNEPHKEAMYIMEQIQKRLNSPTQGKDFCPSCGSQDITYDKEIVFGDPGYFIKATCRNCGRHF